MNDIDYHATRTKFSRAAFTAHPLRGTVIVAPHYVVLGFLSLWNSILDFIKFWVVLFTGTIPQSTYEFQKKLWQ